MAEAKLWIFVSHQFNYRNKTIILSLKLRYYAAAPNDTAGDVVQRISDRAGVSAADGWALYQVRR